MVLSLGMSLATPSRWRLLAALTSIVAAVGLIITYSRGAWLGGIAAIAVFLALTRLRFAAAVASAVLLATTAGAMLAGVDVSSLIYRLDSTFSVAANQVRVILARAAIAIFLDHPVLGTGMNTFSLVHPRYLSPDATSWSFAHNIFLNMAAEGGAIGLVTFLAVVLTGLRSGWRWIKGASSIDDGIISAAIFSAFIGFLVHEQFDGTMMTVHIGAGFWFLIAMQVAFRPQEETTMERKIARQERVQVDRVDWVDREN
jgi:putative inorganic carbon (HCO3(-)) transporter